jgi:phospholipid/cholesterol/gamma-HCH transport system permease protein
MKKQASSGRATCEGGLTGRLLKLTIAGRLDAESVARLWPVVHRHLGHKGIEAMVVDGSGIQYCDGAGTGLLVYIRQTARRLAANLEFIGLSGEIAGLLALYPVEKILVSEKPPSKGAGDLVEQIGKTFWMTIVGLKQHVSFAGELAVGLVKALLHPRSLRAKDFLLVTEASGPQALPIIVMLGFLVGLIMAFQGAVLMKQFGAEIYIADFVGISVARELGPLITAIIVAGRTGSAFAAELGTMKVNEEIDALSTMGLDPVRFLVIPRVLAATLMTPLLAVMTNIAGFLGGAVVMDGLQFPMVTYVNRLLGAVTTADYLGGLAKALVFGLLIAAAGCNCGLRTGEGASAVGNSATRAVVSSITLVVIADGIFAVLFFYLGI